MSSVSDPYPWNVNLSGLWKKWKGEASRILSENPLSFKDVIHANYTKNPPIVGDVYIGWKKEDFGEDIVYKLIYFPPHDINIDYDALGIFMKMFYDTSLNRWAVVKEPTHIPSSDSQLYLRMYDGWILLSDIITPSIKYLNWFEDNPLANKNL